MATTAANKCINHDSLSHDGYKRGGCMLGLGANHFSLRGDFGGKEIISSAKTCHRTNFYRFGVLPTAN